MKEKILLVLTILFGLGMVVFGANKLVPFIDMKPTPEQMELFGAFGKIGWIMPLVGVVEIIGGILIAIPKTRALGAIVILPVVVGILAHNLMHEPAALGMTAVFVVINAWAIIDSKDKYLPMVK
jgi:putative oxidoreductase